MSILKIFKKEEVEAKPSPAQTSDANGAPEAKKDEADKQKKGKHGEGHCCGSCS